MKLNFQRPLFRFVLTGRGWDVHIAYRKPWLALLCPSHWRVDIIFAFSAICHPASVTLGFRSFQEKVFMLSLPNLVWGFIRLIACMGLLLVKIAL